MVMNFFDDFSLITRVTKGELIHILESIPESKELVVESCLMRPLDKLVSMSVLNEHNCKRVQQLNMDRSVYWDHSLEHRVFLIRPTIAMAHKICELIKSEPTHHYSIIFVDQRRIFFDAELEKNALFGTIGLYEFNMSLIPVESDLFSLELPSSSSSTCRFEALHMSKALWRLQSLYGLIPTSFCIGANSQEVDKLFRNLSAEQGEPSPTPEQPISHMFLVDREIDLVSPLLTCLTYESMLNDKFEYFCGKVIFGEIVEAKLREKSNIKNRIFPLNNSDAIFSTVRNLHMTAVFPFLSAKTKELQSSLNRVTGLKKVEDMKSFVANELKNLQGQKEQLEMHICACEAILASTARVSDRFPLEQAIVRNFADAAEIYKRLENLIQMRMSAWCTLQVACLWSICGGGIPNKYFKTFQATFLRTYGYEYLPAIYRLHSMHILFERPNVMPSLQSIVNTGKVNANSPSNLIPTVKKSLQMPPFSSIATSLKLCPELENTNTKNSNEVTKGGEKRMGYMFSNAYIPIVSRIVEMTVSEGWNDAKLRRIFGDSVPIFCTNPSPAKPDNRIRKAIIVCFVGGVTFAEVAALRCFAQNCDFRIIIITTNIINRTKFIQNLAET